MLLLTCLLLDATRDDAVFSVDALEVLAAFASQRAYHKDFSCESSLDAEGTWSGVLVMSSDKFIDVVGWIFHLFVWFLKLCNL